LPQREVGAPIRAYHFCDEGTAVVRGHSDDVGAGYDVIVGHGIAGRRNEEAGTLTRHRPTAAARTALQAGGQAIRTTEAAEETLHRRARLERRVVVVLVGAVVLGSLVGNVDLDRNHRRLHTLDDVGKADRPLDLADLVVDLRVRRAGEDIDGALRRRETIDRRAEA